MDCAVLLPIQAVLLAAACVASLTLPVCAVGQSPDFSTAKVVSPEAQAQADRYFVQTSRNVLDTTLDSPADSTTGRAQWLEGMYPGPLHGETDSTQTRFMHLLVCLLQQDPYPKVRYVAALRLVTRLFPVEERYDAFARALDDPCLAVRVVAATNLLWLSKYEGKALSPSAEGIIRAATMGRDRSNWNVKGLYTRAEMEKDSGVVEKCRDEIQRTAVRGYDGYLGNVGKVRVLLDSVAEHGESDVLRKAARHGVKLLYAH
jgi:hypothetical protein